MTAMIATSALSRLILSHPHSSVPLALLGIAALSAVVCALVVFRQVQAARRSMTKLALERDELTTALGASSAQQKKQVKDADTKKEELAELKKEAGALKKKLFLTQEEQKKAQARHAEELGDARRSAASRPAFAEPVPVRPAPPEEKKKPQAQVEVAVPDPALVSELSLLRASHDELATKLNNKFQELLVLKSESATQQATQNADIRWLQKRIEDYRRIDLVGKNRVELLHERLKQMGRQYYDAVSELAVLKGEVPPPREPELTNETPELSFAGADDADSDSESQSPADHPASELNAEC